MPSGLPAGPVTGDPDTSTLETGRVREFVLPANPTEAEREEYRRQINFAARGVSLCQANAGSKAKRIDKGCGSGEEGAAQAHDFEPHPFNDGVWCPSCGFVLSGRDILTIRQAGRIGSNTR